MPTNSAFQTFGRFMLPESEKTLQLASIDGSLDLGDVVQADTGNTPWLLECVGSEYLSIAELKQVVVREKYASGSASVKLALRLWFLRNSFTGAAKGAVRTLPSNPDDVLGYVDIPSASYIDYDDDGTATNGYSIAIVKDVNLRLVTGLHKDTYVLVTANEGSKSYLSSAQLDFGFIFQRH